MKNIYKVLLYLQILALIPAAEALCQDLTFYENKNYDKVPEDEYLLKPDECTSIIDLNGEWEYLNTTSGRWEKVFIPSCYTGTRQVKFRKKFIANTDLSNKNLNLVALGINYITIIKLNGIIIGTHSGGYSSFSIPIPGDLIKTNQENELEITTENKLKSNVTIPPFLPVSEWANYGGIFREIYIEALPYIWVEKVDLDYEYNQDNTECRLTANIKIKNDNPIKPSSNRESDNSVRDNLRNITFFALVYDPILQKNIYRTEDFRITINKTYEKTVVFNVKNMSLWSPEEPRLYDVRVLITQGPNFIHRWKKKIGFRKIEISRGKIFLNNEELKLFGVNRIEDYPDYGSSHNWELIEKDILKIKNLGCNLIRGGNFPNHPYFYSLCDKYGLFTIEEIPLSNIKSDALEGLQVAHSYARETISRDIFHPSILAWGIGEDIYGNKDKTAGFLDNLIKGIKELDNRPVYYFTRLTNSDFPYEKADIIGLSFPGTDFSEISRTLDRFNTRFPDKPLFSMLHVMPLLKSPNSSLKDSDLLQIQARSLITNVDSLIDKQGVNGYLLANFSDWRRNTPAIAENIFNSRYIETTGLLDYNRNDRTIYQHIKKILNRERRPAPIAAQRKNDNHPAYILIGFVIIASLIVLTRQSETFTENLKRAILYPKSFFPEIKDLRVIPVWQGVVISIFTGLTLGMGISAFCYFYRTSPFLDFFFSTLVANEEYKIAIAKLVWNPYYFTVTFMLIFLLAGVFISLLLFIISFVLGERSNFGHVMLIQFWITVNLLLLLPISMILYPALNFSLTISSLMTVLILFFIWFVYRFFICFKHSFEINIGKVTGIYLSFFLLIYLCAEIYIVKSQLSWDKLIYLWTILQN